MSRGYSPAIPRARREYESTEAQRSIGTRTTPFGYRETYGKQTTGPNTSTTSRRVDNASQSIKNIPIIKGDSFKQLNKQMGSMSLRAASSSDSLNNHSGPPSSLSSASSSNNGSPKNHPEHPRKNTTYIFSSSSKRDYVDQIQSPSSLRNFLCNIEDLGLTGLSNLGNTCFMNSVLQCLSNTPELLQFCLETGRVENDLNKNSNMKGNLILSYVDLMRDLWRAGPRGRISSSVSPVAFKTQVQKFAPRFMGYNQQDAQEFLRYLLEGLHEDLNRIKVKPKPILPDYESEDKMHDANKSNLYWERYLKRDDSIIVDLFMGQLKSTLECTTCGFRSTTFDPFWDLSLPIAKRSSVDILDCVRLFTAKEELNGVEKPMCGKCKQRRRCTKYFSIQCFPKILVLHLKRFSGERFRSKMSTLVSFPSDRLDLTEFAAQSCRDVSKARYQLYAVSNHSGGCYSGHYTAFCRHPSSQDWFEFNDSRVTSMQKSSLVSSEAYVLFYRTI